MDLDQIRTKLKSQVRSQSQPLANPPVDWPKTLLQRQRNQAGSSLAMQPTKLVNTLEALQHRSSHGEGAYPVNPIQPTDPQNPGLETEALQEAAIHIKRLQTLAERINGLSAEQEQLIGEIRAVEGRLNQLSAFCPEGLAPSSAIPTVHLDNAVLAWAESDLHSNFIITYRSANILNPEQEAHQLADHLRGTYGKESGHLIFSLSALWKDCRLVWQEPAELTGRFLHRMVSLRRLLGRKVINLSSVGFSPAFSSRQSAWTPLSLVDMLLWFGGGVIGRVALNLLLAAFPPMWSLAVAMLTGVTAYALYCASLAPRRDFGLAYRVFLVIAGLLIGGQF